MAQIDQSRSPKRLVRLKDAAHILGVPIEVFPNLVVTIGCAVVADRWRAPCISFEDFERLHEHPKVIEAALEAALNEAERRRRDKVLGTDEILKKEIGKKLMQYRKFIVVLQEIHLKYLTRILPVQKRTALAAAYLLYARVINVLNMGCACMEAGYWNAGIVLRQVDEAIQVAEYFSTTESTPTLQRDVDRWFRENRSPQPMNIRKAIAARMGMHMGAEQGERHLYVMNELYELKSKWIHPTFSPIREMLQIEPRDGKAVVTGFDYAASTNLRKLHEFTLFYRSSIWTAVQGFLMCFQHQIPLEEEDSKRLLQLNRRFTVEPDGL
jgi:hypothetical protein